MEQEQKFIENVADIFEVEPDEVSMDMDFRKDIDEFSSLIGFSLIVMMEDEYGVKVSVDDFLKCVTVRDLYDKCFPN